MNYKTIPEMFFSVVNSNPDKNILNYKEDGNWNQITGKELKNCVESLSCALTSIGLKAKDKIGILSSTSYQWAICDYSILASSMTTVTVYPTLALDQVEFILKNSEAKLIFVENIEQFSKIDSIFNKCKDLDFIVLMDNSENIQKDYVYTLNELVKVGDVYRKNNNVDIENNIKVISEDDLVTLIYTSGTTGMPKGVMLSHKNLISNLGEVSKLQDNIGDEKFLSFLPLSHVLERMAGHFFAMWSNSKIYYAENIETVGENMAEISPSIVVCVPRFFEKMYNKIIAGLDEAPDKKKKIFYWALKVGKDYTNIIHAKQKVPLSLRFKHTIANTLVYKKVREKLGGNIKFFISGGAPLSPKIAEFFAGIGITILEGYGLTETSPVLTSNTPNDIRFGYVGRPLNNVKLKIATDGEILAQGPNVMLGYYKNEDATKEVIDSEGWFHTGDIGEIDNDGFLKITDRKKSLIVTSAGKNIAPAPLENSINTSEYVEQVLVLGDQKNFISALIVPNFDNVNNYLISLGKDKLSNEAIVDHPEVIKLFSGEIEKLMNSFSSYETVKKFKLLSKQFSIERGEMTPKMSIVRKKVIQNYTDLIESIYN
jgi:long-chain acyl-CoA synthetase